MIVSVVSADEGLLALCREIASEFPGAAWDLHLTRGLKSGVDSDLYVWDFIPEIELPAELKWGTHHFALVRAQDLERFRADHRYAEPGVILKPVTRAALRGLFSHALSLGGSVRADRDELLQSLIEANLRLQQYDEERTNFLSRAIHDVQAPLTALSGYCELLREQQLGPLSEKQRMIVGRMCRSAQRLTRLTQSMFRMTTGSRAVKRGLEMQPANLADCVEQAIHETANLFDEKSIETELQLDPVTYPLLFDPVQIEQVLVNLLENAGKFTPRMGRVTISGYSYFWERRASNVTLRTGYDRRFAEANEVNAYRIDIADSGPGILPEHAPTIFEEYVSYAGGRDRAGAGLGLAICRNIVEQHGGRIWAENTANGAMFSIVLPFQLGAVSLESELDQPAYGRTALVAQ